MATSRFAPCGLTFVTQLETWYENFRGHHLVTSRVLACLFLTLTVLFADGCASIRNTPAQDLAQERWDACRGIPGVELKEIRPDGQIWVVWLNYSGAKAWQECDRRMQVEQAKRTSVARTSPPPIPAGPNPAPKPPSGVTGIYLGPFTGTQGGREFTLQITLRVAQDGERLSGTWTAGPASGTASGTVSGAEIINFRAEQITPCPGVLSGTVGIEERGTKLRGAFAGQACQGPVAASFVVTRQ
jgi:hypothetical protein